MSTHPQPRTRTFASLSVHNYRLFFFSALVSNIGTWMGRTAQAWLVLTVLTDHSASALGVVTALQFGPMLFLAPYGGVIADRYSKRTIMLVTQVALGLNQLALWLLVVTGTAQLWHVYLLAGLMAVITAFDNPARQAFASEMVGPDLLSNAVGLNSASFNFARLLGPGAAGLIISWWGLDWAMLINAGSFLAVLLGLIMMRSAELISAPPRKGRGAFAEGLRYVAGKPDIVLMIVLIFVFGSLGMNFNITNALMATTVFHKGAAEFGLLGSIMAIGSLTAALLAARRERPRLSVVIGALLGFAVFATLLALAPSYELFCLFLVPVGMVSIMAMNTANARVQLSADPQFRGRVMSLYMAIFMGGTLIGSPLVGVVGDAFGARWTILMGSIATGIAAVGAVVWLLATGRTSREAIVDFLLRRTHDESPVAESVEIK